MTKNIMINDLSRLKWACRRGMLELDVLLGNFLSESYQSLSDEDKERFVALLESPDTDLLSWLMGHSTPSEPDLLKIVELMRHHARTRF